MGNSIGSHDVGNDDCAGGSSRVGEGDSSVGNFSCDGFTSGCHNGSGCNIGGNNLGEDDVTEKYGSEGFFVGQECFQISGVNLVKGSVVGGQDSEWSL